eukprot:1497872-Amphidinium_carterae.1
MIHHHHKLYARGKSVNIGQYAKTGDTQVPAANPGQHGYINGFRVVPSPEQVVNTSLNIVFVRFGGWEWSP